SESATDGHRFSRIRKRFRCCCDQSVFHLSNPWRKMSRKIHARVTMGTGSKFLFGGAPMNTHSISRRHFAHLLGVGAAAAIVRPRITIAKESLTVPAPAKTGVVRLSANENPYGPSDKARDAMNNAHGVCNRYPDEANDVLIDKI